MKDYKKEDAAFSEEMKLYEPSDRAHADVLNIPLKLLYENTMALMWLWNNRMATEKLNGLMTSQDKTKLDNVEEGANKTDVDIKMSDSSQNPVQNKIVKAYIDHVKDEILGGASGAYDTLKEIETFITEHSDAYEALLEISGNKVDKVDGKGLSTNDLTDTLKSNYDAAYEHAQSAHAPGNAEVNQNAFSNMVIGSETIAAASKTDSLELAGSNVTITPDEENKKVTFEVTKSNVCNALGYTPPSASSRTVTDLKELANYPSMVGAVRIDNGSGMQPVSSWRNVISIRHNADYGMYLYTPFTSGDLKWRRHCATNSPAWSDEMTLLDSANFKNYVHSLQKKVIFSGNKFIKEGITQVSLSNLESSFYFFEAVFVLVGYENETVCPNMRVVFGSDTVATQPLCGYAYPGYLGAPPSVAMIPVTIDSFDIGNGKTTAMTITVPCYGFYVDLSANVDTISSDAYSLYLSKITGYY